MVWINGYQDWLSDADSLKNAQKVVDCLYKSGSDWTKESVSALIGNMKHESSINPNMYEYGYSWEEDRGFGLVQWTPRSKFWDWGVSNGYSESELRSGDSQLSRLDYEVDNNIQYIANGHQWRYGMGDKYDFSFTHFRTNQPGLTVEQLTEAFMWNYEGPAYEAGTGSLIGRQAFALQAFNELNWNGGGDPDPPDPPDPPPGTDIKKIEEMIATLYDFSNGQFGNSFIKGTKTMDNMYKLEVTQAFRDKISSGGSDPNPPDPEEPDNKPYPPVSNYTNITAIYGYSDDYDGWHAGLDFGGIVAGVDGDPIYATMNGTVEIAEFNNGGLGNVVWIKHSDDAYFSAYAHLSGFNTTVGSAVEKGDVIGYMGNTGYSLGTHLHFVVATVLWGNNESNTIDPKPYLGI